MITQHRPSLVLGVGSLAVDSSNLRQLRRAADRAGALLAFWVHDDPYEFDYAYKADCADVLFSNDAWSVEHYRRANVHHLPLAASRNAHLRELTPIRNRDLALFFCGVAYPNRIDFIRKADDLLCRHSVRILGAGWPSDIRCARNQRLSTDGMADHAQRSRLTLNIGRDLPIANQRYALPASTPGPRTFEVALSGSPQLYFVSGLEILNYFDSPSEIILIDSISDLARALERAYEEPETLDTLAAGAQQRALREHTYNTRILSILSTCALNIERTAI
jgi:spore maturation protein CgeB